MRYRKDGLLTAPDYYLLTTIPDPQDPPTRVFQGTEVEMIVCLNKLLGDSEAVTEQIKSLWQTKR